MSLKPMSAHEITAHLSKVPQWSECSGSIQRTYQFKHFIDAMAFVNKIAQYAEKAQHHPDILIRWNKVTLTVHTHDAGGITTKDFDLAAASDALM